MGDDVINKRVMRSEVRFSLGYVKRYLLRNVYSESGNN